MLQDLTGQDVPWDKVHVIQVGRFALKEELAGRLRAAGHETCESSMIATRIELILIVSGAATATMLSQFFAPPPVLRLIYGEARTDGVSVALARQWGLLIFCVGALLIYAAFYPPVRAPILVFAVMEKVGLGGVCVLGPSLRRQGIVACLWRVIC